MRKNILMALLIFVILRWITQDATDQKYPYKLTDDDFAHLVRDCIAVAPRLLSNRIPPQTNKKTLQIYFQPMKPAKKAGVKAKKVNKLKKAVTAKAKKALKTKKK